MYLKPWKTIQSSGPQLMPTQRRIPESGYQTQAEALLWSLHLLPKLPGASYTGLVPRINGNTYGTWLSTPSFAQHLCNSIGTQRLRFCICIYIFHKVFSIYPRETGSSTLHCILRVSRFTGLLDRFKRQHPSPFCIEVLPELIRCPLASAPRRRIDVVGTSKSLSTAGVNQRTKARRAGDKKYSPLRYTALTTLLSDGR